MTISNDNLVKNAIMTADKLFAEREHFEIVTLARTNAELYGILEKVYKLYADANDGNYLKDLIKQMEDKLVERGVKVQKNTPKLTVVVRYIFNCDRKKANKYKKVIEVAYQQNVQPSGLSTFITDNNGIENVKLVSNPSEKMLQKRNRLEQTISIVEEQLEAMQSFQTVKFANQRVALSDDVPFAFVLARVNSNGDFELLQPVPKPTIAMKNAAIKSIAEYVIEETDKNSDEAIKEMEAKLRKDVASTLTIAA